MGTVAKRVSMFCGCCVSCCLPRKALDNFNQQFSMYTHVGDEVLLFIIHVFIDLSIHRFVALMHFFFGF